MKQNGATSAWVDPRKYDAVISRAADVNFGLKREFVLKLHPRLRSLQPGAAQRPARPTATRRSLQRA